MKWEIEAGNRTPGPMDETFNVTATNYERNRLSVMCDYGLVERLHRSLYRLTDDGRAFHNEDLDA